MNTIEKGPLLHRLLKVVGVKSPSGILKYNRCKKTSFPIGCLSESIKILLHIY